MKFKSLLAFCVFVIASIVQRQMFSQSNFPPVVERALFVSNNDLSDHQPSNLEDAFPTYLSFRPNHVQCFEAPMLRHRKEAGFFLANKQSIVLYDPEGQFKARWNLSPDLAFLIDFATHPDGLLVLWRDNRSQHHITLFDSKGNQTGEEELLPLEHCYPTQVLASLTRMFVHFQGAPCYSLSENGDYSKSYSNGKVNYKLFPADESSWGGLGYSQEKDLDLGIVVRPGNLPGSQEIQTSVWPKRYGMLIGIDASGAFLMRGTNFLNGADNLSRVDAHGKLRGSMPLSGVVCSGDGCQIATFVWEEGGIRLSIHSDSNTEQMFYPMRQVDKALLVGAGCVGDVDTKGVVSLHFGDAMGRYNTTLRMHRGKQEILHLKDAFITSQTANSDKWQVTREGKVLVPISTPAGVVVVSIQF